MQRNSHFDLFGDVPSRSDPRTLYTQQEISQQQSRDPALFGAILGTTNSVQQQQQQQTTNKTQQEQEYWRNFSQQQQNHPHSPPQEQRQRDIRDIPPHLRPNFAQNPTKSTSPRNQQPPRREQEEVERQQQQQQQQQQMLLPPPIEGSDDFIIEDALQEMERNNVVLSRSVDDAQRAVTTMCEVLDTQRALTRTLREKFEMKRRNDLQANASRNVLVRVLEADEQQQKQQNSSSTQHREDWW